MNKDIAAASNILRRLFAPYQGADSLSRSDLLKAVGGANEQQSIISVYQGLAKLRKFGFIETRYDTVQKNRLTSITLTATGKRVLSGKKVGDPRMLTAADRRRSRHYAPFYPDLVSLDRVLEDISVLRQQMPSFKIMLAIRPKTSLKQTNRYNDETSHD